MKNQSIQHEIHAADQAINRQDFEAVANFYTEDAILVVKPGLLANGQGEIRDALEQICQYFNGSLNVSQGDMVVIEAGNTALVMSKTIIKSPQKLDSEFSTERDAIYVFVKDSSGRWLCAIDNSYGVELLKTESL